MSKPQPEQWFAQIMEEHTPKKNIPRNCLTAFLGGGTLCAAAEAVCRVLMRGGMQQDTACALVTLGVIGITALLTGFCIYDKAAQQLGAGMAVPISGFANSVASAMLEHKYEGLVMGSGCNSFKLAGAVVVFGIASAFVSALAVVAFGAV